MEVVLANCDVVVVLAGLSDGEGIVGGPEVGGKGEEVGGGVTHEGCDTITPPLLADVLLGDENGGRGNAGEVCGALSLACC